jgi:outer membrane protein TolC
MRTLISAFSLIFLLLISMPGRAADSAILREYIQQALSKNQLIAQKDYQRQKAELAGREASALFLPKADFLVNYVRADGGRTIDLPIGDLLNPVYANLNRINGNNAFPTLQNVNEQLNPDNFYDARIRISAPLLNTDLIYNQRIRMHLAQAGQADLATARRDLVRDVKQAWYRWMQSTQAVKIYEQALLLLEEQIRVNRTLQANGIANRTTVLRSQNELEKYKSALKNARNNQSNAAAAFNILLQNPLDAQIQADSTVLNLTAEQIIPQMPSAYSSDSVIMFREENKKFDASLAALQEARNMAAAHWIPKIGAQLDLGSQAFNFRFNQQSRYYLLGIGLEWNIFSAMANTRREEQAQAEYSALEAQKNYVQQQFSLQYYAAQNNLISATEQYRSARLQLNSAELLYTDMKTLYAQGKALYIEMLDAWNQTITARLQSSLALADILIWQAETERASAAYSF